MLLKHTHYRLLLCSCLVFWLVGCGEKPSEQKAQQKRPTAGHLVEVVPIKPEFVTTAHERTGSLWARRTVRIHSQEEGRVMAVPFYQGDRVEKGSTLIRLQDDLLRAELDKIRATTRQARVDLKRIQGLVQKRAASEDELARTRTALDVANAEQKLLETRLAYTQIQAPFDGVISERKVEPGDVVARHDHLLTVIDPDSLVIEIHVSELLLPHLGLEDPVGVRIDALGRSIFSGRIARIYPDLNPVTRQGIVEVVLDPIPFGARAGQFSRVTLESARVERLLVPFAAVKRDRDGNFVYRLDQQNKTHRAPVRTGIRIGDRIEILEGLETGQRIVSRGFLGLFDGKQVEPVNGPIPGAKTD